MRQAVWLRQYANKNSCFYCIRRLILFSVSVGAVVKLHLLQNLMTNFQLGLKILEAIDEPILGINIKKVSGRRWLVVIVGILNFLA